MSGWLRVDAKSDDPHTVFLLVLLVRPLKIVEFCGGSGFVLLPLAYLYPQHRFVLIDMKRTSLDIAVRRISDCSETFVSQNVQIIEGLIEHYEAVFDLGIALHACGSASDIALDK